MRRGPHFVAVIALVQVWASSVSACPVCGSETGQQVRAGIFNEEFGPKLVLTLLPFPVFLGMVAAIHFGFSFWMRRSPQQASLTGAEPADAPLPTTEGRE